MEGVNTDSLRTAAPHWNLAGDKQLLEVLQNIHQSLMTRCQEVTSRLDEMVTALDGASVDLQNVNNKFMALSNSQFIESRVYDDDADVATEEKPKEPPLSTESPSELEQLRSSVRVLQGLHEPIQIVGSDSDTDSDDEELRTILKPVDLYAHRPLPHIIGSHAWRTKWHAGLLPEDSDTDSSVSGRDERDADQYSDSEPEPEPEPEPDGPRGERLRPVMQSPPSSELPPAETQRSPADVAAEIARRLGGHKIPILEQVQDYPPAPAPLTTNKVYRLEKPSASTIFSDEPPPLDQYQSEGEEYSQEEDDDIFAELHKSKPYVHSNKDQSRLAEDLFSGLRKEEVYEERDIFNDFKDQPSSPPASKQKSTLFDDESEPELFVTKQTNKTAPKQQNAPSETETIKKPVGGISLFGSNKGAESIGAAILKRNRRKSSTDEDTISEEAPKPIVKKEDNAKSKEKDIFDDLFAKSAREQKTVKEKIAVKKEKEVKIEKKVDLFSDNLFDDIDDIFTSNISVEKPNKTQKSLFDDDDDLFSEIAVTNNKKETKSADSVKKSIFDSDDDLFSEKTVKKPVVAQSSTQDVVNKSNSKSTEFSEDFKSKSIFDDDNTDSDIFSDLTENKVAKNNVINNDKISESSQIKEPIFESKNLETRSEERVDVLKRTESKINNNESLPSDNVPAKLDSEKKKSNNESLFGDDDDDSDDLFLNSSKKPKSITVKPTISTKPTKNANIKNTAPKEIQKSSLFDDDDDDLFVASNKPLKNASINSEDAISSNNKSANYGLGINKENLLKDTVTDDFESDDFFAEHNKPCTGVDNSNNNTESKASIDEPPNKLLVDNEVEDDLFLNINNNRVSANPKNREKNDDNSFTPENENLVFRADISDEVIDNNINSEVVPTKLENKSDGIFDEDFNDKLFNDDHISNKVNDSGQTKIDLIDKEVNPNLPEPDFNISEPIKTVTDKNEVKDSLFDTPNDSIFSTPDVFSTIIDEPPAFEKPKEPKKSKNINALFDDDSDDEALFLKKNDTVLDEKPQISSDSKRDALFGIFHDEPPSIDVDFTQKTNKTNVDDDFFKSDSDNDLFNTTKSIEKPKPSFSSESSQKTVIEQKTSQTELTTESSSKLDENSLSISKRIEDHTPEEIKSNVTNKQKPDVTDGFTEPKKIGKLKSMNININVNTLLPGASPKKKQIEQIDGPVLSTKSNEDLHSNDKVEPALIKSVSFDGEPDSQVLDNKISKERAKIQVKRRPSTRRARREAVRKSAIDFGDDSTDNSSSFDDPPKAINADKPIKPEVNKNEPSAESEPIKNESDTETRSIKNEISTTEIENRVENTANVTDIKTEPSTSSIEVVNDKDADVYSNKNEQIDNAECSFEPTQREIDRIENLNKESVEANIPVKDTNLPSTDETNIGYRKDVKSKVVYILNDEDIFNTKVETKQNDTKKVLNIIDDDDEDLFKNTGKETTISTLGNVYKENSAVDTQNTKIKSQSETKPKMSLFDDLSEDENELFNTTKKVIPKAKSILDSDSEEDLFGGKSRTETRAAKVASGKETKDAIASSVKETKNLDVKTSLFGDDDDEDDLFGAKVKTTKTGSTSFQSSKPATKDLNSKPPEPVFEDPLSLLGGHEE